MQTNIYIEGGNSFGIAFRYRDPFNYYVFEMSKLKNGYVRLSKVVKGKLEVLQTVMNGGFNPKVWYLVKIEAQQNNLKVWYSSAEKNTEKSLQLIFDLFDNEHVHGTIAFAANGVDRSLIDNIAIVPKKCKEGSETNLDNQIIISPTCPRYIETYKENVTQRWETVDPLEVTNGPSAWTLAKEVDGRELVFFNNSRVFGSSSREEGSLYFLNEAEKVITKGNLSVKFKPLDEGIVGLVFKMESETKYYIAEITSKSVRIRKRSNNNYVLLSENNKLGYKVGEWNKAIVIADNNKLNVLLSIDFYKNSMAKAFESDVVDNEIHHGKVGLSTYNSRTYFDEIKLEPFDNPDAEEEKITIDDPKAPKETKVIRKSSENAVYKDCTKHTSTEDRKRDCAILFKSNLEVATCKVKF